LDGAGARISGSYLQLSLYLAPSHPLALLSLGDLYEAMKKPELANKIYERVPLTSPSPQCADPTRAQPGCARSHGRGESEP
jgi:hypothetical protein